MAGWTTLEKLLKGEIIQREEEGCDVTGFAQRLEEAAGDNGRLNRLYDELMELKPGEDFPFEEPDSLEEIRAMFFLPHFSIGCCIQHRRL